MSKKTEDAAPLDGIRELSLHEYELVEAATATVTAMATAMGETATAAIGRVTTVVQTTARGAASLAVLRTA